MTNYRNPTAQMIAEADCTGDCSNCEGYNTCFSTNMSEIIKNVRYQGAFQLYSAFLEKIAHEEPIYTPEQKQILVNIQMYLKDCLKRNFEEV